MSGYTAYLELPSGERIELPATMPDITEADSPLWDGKFELPEAVAVLYSSVLLSVQARCKTGLPFLPKPHPHGYDGNGCAAV